MKQTKNSNTKLDKKWKVMKESKKHISDIVLSEHEEYELHKYEFICWAVSWKDTRSRVGIAGSIRNDITKYLGGHMSLQEWLSENSIATYEVTCKNPQKLQTTRKAWVDWMIEDYKSRDE